MKKLRKKLEFELEVQRTEYSRQKLLFGQKDREIFLAQYIARIDLLQRLLRKNE